MYSAFATRCSVLERVRDLEERRAVERRERRFLRHHAAQIAIPEIEKRLPVDLVREQQLRRERAAVLVDVVDVQRLAAIRALVLENHADERLCVERVSRAQALDLRREQPVDLRLLIGLVE